MKKIIFCIVNFYICINVFAVTAPCHGQFINPVTIDWRAMFPITIGSSTVMSGQLPDTTNPSNPICVCPGDPLPQVGISMGYWEPMALVDVTHTPYCFVNLNGMHVIHDDGAQGDADTQSTDQNSSFYYVHYYNFPLMKWINFGLLGGSCQTDGDFSLGYFGELDPTWRDDNLAAILFPESEFFKNPIFAVVAQGKCAFDSVKANFGLPNDNPYWCAGSQGFMYPLDGKVSETASTAQAQTLLVERTLFRLHRLGMVSDTSANELCDESHSLFMPKSRYRYQMIYPKNADAEPFGRTTMVWDSNAENMLSTDDAGFLIWRKRNCCNY